MTSDSQPQVDLRLARTRKDVLTTILTGLVEDGSEADTHANATRVARYHGYSEDAGLLSLARATERSAHLEAVA